MLDDQEIYFEIFDSGNLVRLEPIEYINYNSDSDWDKNWIKTKVTVKGGEFSGQYSGYFMTTYFETLKHELSRLYDNLAGVATCNDLEGFLELKINGDGFGHFNVNVKASDQPGLYTSELIFNLQFDQTELRRLSNQLKHITKHFPVIGDLSK